MSELVRRGGQVAHGPDVLGRGLQGPVDLDVASVQLDAGLPVPEALAHRAAPHRHQADVGVRGLGRSLGLVRHRDGVARLLHFLHLGPGEGLDAALAERALQFLGHVLVLQGRDARERFHHGHLGPE